MTRLGEMPIEPRHFNRCASTMAFYLRGILYEGLDMVDRVLESALYLGSQS